MLIIRAAQFEALSECFVLPEYEETMLAYVRHAYPEIAAARGRDALLEQIRRLRRQALRHGASDPVAWGQYAALALRSRPGFEHEPPVAAILADPTAAWHRKFDRLSQLLPQSGEGGIDDSATATRKSGAADF